jgi:uncharacterized membrane protein YfcA
MNLLVHSTVEWAILGVSALVIGFSKTGLPGFGILSIPLTALVLPAKASTGIILPMLIAGDMLAVAFYRRHAQWRHLFRLFPWAFTGILVGYCLLAVVTDAQLRPVIGALILVMLVLTKWRERNENGGADDMLPRHWSFAVIIGLLAGIATMMANAAGPVMMIYLLAMKLPKNEFIGTSAWYFLIINCFKVPFSCNLGLINHDSLMLNLCLLPAIMSGALLGIVVFRIIPQKLFVNLAQFLALVAAVKLLF